jgi:hypothetical protein
MLGTEEEERRMARVFGYGQIARDVLKRLHLCTDDFDHIGVKEMGDAWAGEIAACIGPDGMDWNGREMPFGAIGKGYVVRLRLFG